MVRKPAIKFSSLLIGGIFMIITTLGFQDKQEELDVLKNGNLVEAEITHLPGSCLGTKAKWYMRGK